MSRLSHWVVSLVLTGLAAVSLLVGGRERSSLGVVFGVVVPMLCVLAVGLLRGALSAFLCVLVVAAATTLALLLGWEPDDGPDNINIPLPLIVPPLLIVPAALGGVGRLWLSMRALSPRQPG